MASVDEQLREAEREYRQRVLNERSQSSIRALEGVIRSLPPSHPAIEYITKAILTFKDA